MTKIFREDAPGCDSLRGFFLAWREINPEKLSILSRRFMELVYRSESGAVDIIAELSELFPDRRGQKGRAPKEACASFLEELTVRLGESLREGRARLDTLEEWLAAVRGAFLRLDVYNVSPQTIVETLFYRMREAAR
jgi:hypothetical protein